MNKRGYKQLYLIKKTDSLFYLHAKSDHPASLKKSVRYCQILRVKRIGSTNSKFERICKVLQEQFTKRGIDSSSIDTEIKKIKLLDSKIRHQKQHRKSYQTL